jgi:hypothetical protein
MTARDFFTGRSEDQKVRTKREFGGSRYRPFASTTSGHAPTDRLLRAPDFYKEIGRSGEDENLGVRAAASENAMSSIPDPGVSCAPQARRTTKMLASSLPPDLLTSLLNPRNLDRTAGSPGTRGPCSRLRAAGAANPKFSPSDLPIFL